MQKKSRVLLDDYEETYCEMCGTTLECDEYGDMPETCPRCGRLLDYSIFERRQQEHGCNGDYCDI